MSLEGWVMQTVVIASGAKQSRFIKKDWIASSPRLLAITVEISFP